MSEVVEEMEEVEEMVMRVKREESDPRRVVQEAAQRKRVAVDEAS